MGGGVPDCGTGFEGEGFYGGFTEVNLRGA